MKKIHSFLKKYEFPVHLFVGWRIISVRFLTVLCSVIAKLKFKMLGCQVGRNFKVDGKLWLWMQKKGCVQIGDNVRINSRFGSNLVGLTNPAVLQCLENGRISIGNNCGFSSPILSTRSSIAIGDNVLLGGNVRIFDHDYHSLDSAKRHDPVTDGASCKRAPVVIGDDVFVGTNAIILKGVTIGDRAIIGAGSIVSCDVPSDEIWAGNPAKCVKGSMNAKDQNI